MVIFIREKAAFNQKERLKIARKRNVYRSNSREKLLPNQIYAPFTYPTQTKLVIEYGWPINMVISSGGTSSI